jgi:methylmalonyl-CoA mutase N-terminal domain/subunit
MPGEPHKSWQVRPRSSAPADGAPPAREVLDEELSRIERRIDDVIAQGRESFTEGADSYDRATVAILRPAALFEQPRRFSAALEVVTPEERRGITTTRDLVAHRGYGAMNTAVFWSTVTERLPEIIARIRGADQG